MINPEVKKQFLSRPLKHFDWLKQWPAKDLKQETPELSPDTWDHQRACYLLLSALKRFMLLIDMGGGKTSICLQLVKHLKHTGKGSKAIVFVPYVTSVSTWIDETAKHTPELVCMPLTGGTQDNLQKLLQADGDLFVICYASAVAMMAEPVKRIGKRNKKKWAIDPKRVREEFGRFNVLVLDEVHRCK